MVWGVSCFYAFSKSGMAYHLLLKWAVVSFFVMFIAFSLSELASAAPTSGGLYYWTFKYASPRYRRLLSWLVGCEYGPYTLWCLMLILAADSNTMGNIAGAASVQWGCAVQLMAAVSIGRGLTFTATSGQIQ